MTKQSKFKAIGAFVLGLFLGIIFGGGSCDCPTCPECPEPEVKTKEVVREVEVYPHKDTWKELKSVDDQIIALDAEVEIRVAEAIEALTDGDLYTVDNITKWVEQQVEIKQGLIRRRSELLGELGY